MISITTVREALDRMSEGIDAESVAADLLSLTEDDDVLECSEDDCDFETDFAPYLLSHLAEVHDLRYESIEDLEDDLTERKSSSKDYKSARKWRKTAAGKMSIRKARKRAARPHAIDPTRRKASRKAAKQPRRKAKSL